MYERTLREIDKSNWQFAHQLFQFVSVSSRPLRVEELAELLAFDFEAGPVPEFHEDWHLEDPVDAVLSVCSSLLAVVNVEGYESPVIQFSHVSVKEFLTSTRLAEASDIIHRRFHVSMTSAHTLASLACLGIILHFDEDTITRDSLETYPLAEYAAEHWVYHARFEGVSPNVEDGMKQLFDPSKSHLAVCIWIHDAERIWQKGIHRDEEPPIPESPLYYAALLGLHSMVHYLVIELSHDVNERSDTDDATALHVASQNGEEEVARFLLELGADISALDEEGYPPLHRAFQGGHVEVAQILIERGADILTEDKYGCTPLHRALTLGYVEVAQMLIERGADVSAQDMFGILPLHQASEVGYVEIAQMLIEHGADVSAEDMKGKTPLHFVSTPSDSAIINRPQQSAKLARILLEHGANITAQDYNRLTPLDLASKDERLAEVASVLIEHGASPGAHQNGT
jgi:ankyrin repeat protein